MHVFPAYLTGRLCLLPVFTGLAARAPAHCELRGGAPPGQPSAVVRTWHRHRQSLGWATCRPVPGHVPCATPRLVPHVAQQRAGRRAGMRHGATLRLSGAAHQPAQRRTDTSGAARRAHRQRTRPWSAGAAPGSGSGRQDGQCGWATCKCGNSHWQTWPSRQARVVTGWQESRDRRGGDLPT